MITRDVEAAEAREYDLIVIGGGVYGCAVALEAARRGLRPLLLERDDFGQHTSANWLRIVHGGLRYLQRADLRRHRLSCEARRWFLRSFPELVEPLRCLMPLYGRGLLRPAVLRAALLANALLSTSRNRGVRPDRCLAAGEVVPRDEVIRAAPSVASDGLVGGAVWYDAVARQPQRLLMAILAWAQREGATLANHVEVLRVTQEDGRVTGVAALDRSSGRRVEFRAPIAVNCAGPWAPEIAQPAGGSPAALFRPSLAINVLFDRRPDFQGALAVRADRPGGRTYFLHTAAGRVLAGTYHSPVGEPDDAAPADGDLAEAFARELHPGIPRLELASSEVLHVFRGYLPVAREGTVDLTRRPLVHHHGGHGGPVGLFSVSGVKFTESRHVAAQTIARLERAGLCDPVHPSPDPPPPGRLLPSPAALFGPDGHLAPTTTALIHDIVRDEAVVDVDDLLWRRTDWGLDPAAAEAVRPVARAALQGPIGTSER